MNNSNNKTHRHSINNTSNTTDTNNIIGCTVWLCCNKRVPCVKYCESSQDKHKCGILEKSKYNKHL